MAINAPAGTAPIVVVTGASAGVGRAAARAFAAKGYDVGLVARGEDGLDAVRREVEAQGRRAHAVPTDVSDADAVERAAKEIEDELGPIDVWVNDAMSTVFGPFLGIEPDEFERVTRVTYLGYVNGTRAALHRMVPRDKGVIIQVGSALAYRGIPLQSAYCGSKHAIRGFSDSIRAELLHDRTNIRITDVHLAAMNTPQFDIQRSKLDHQAQPVPPIFQPEVAAKAIVAAAEQERRSIWVGSPTVATILGGFFAPRLVDAFLGRTGYASQQTPERDDPDRPDALESPLPGDHGAHGRFDDEAKSRSRELDFVLSRPVSVAMQAFNKALEAAGNLLAKTQS
jgi:short-subunit dehydrogenase